jgi:hypothetical protein
MTSGDVAEHVAQDLRGLAILTLFRRVRFTNPFTDPAV